PFAPAGDVVSALLAPLGITPDPASNVPVITDITNVACTVDPANQGVPDGTGGTFYANTTCPGGSPCSNPNQQNIITNGGDGSPALAGVLSFTGVLQFQVPQNH